MAQEEAQAAALDGGRRRFRGTVVARDRPVRDRAVCRDGAVAPDRAVRPARAVRAGPPGRSKRQPHRQDQQRGDQEGHGVENEDGARTDRRDQGPGTEPAGGLADVRAGGDDAVRHERCCSPATCAIAAPDAGPNTVPIADARMPRPSSATGVLNQRQGDEDARGQQFRADHQLAPVEQVAGLPGERRSTRGPVRSSP